MSAYPLKAWQFVGCILAVFLFLPHPSQAQEPSQPAYAAYQAGVAALARNDFNTALQEFEKVVRLSPSLEQGHSALGTVLVRTGRTSEGIRELQKALAMNPNDGSTQLNLALAYDQTVNSPRRYPYSRSSRPCLAPGSTLCRQPWLRLMPDRWPRRSSFQQRSRE
jgi:tetratricopeptide (TPR) repeat protein